MNKQIIEIFEKLIVKTNNENKKNKNSSTPFKIRTYRKTISILKKLDFEINKQNKDDLKSIKGIGKSTIDKIDEILETGTLNEIASLTTKEMSNSNEINDLQRITGIGPKKAETLYKQDITLKKLKQINFNKLSKSDEDLLSLLTHHQIIGLKYLEDLETRIPRKEIKLIEKYINLLLKKIDPKLNMIVCGSYRRERETSGDMDILITHSDIKTDKDIEYCKDQINFLEEIISSLEKSKFLVDHLTNNGSTKYMGLCKYKNNPVRRIDIRFIPLNSLGSAMLYFTGSGDFNKNMRSDALKKGYTINEYGIFKLKSDGTKGLKIKTRTEKDIFDILKLPYVEPKNRL